MAAGTRVFSGSFSTEERDIRVEDYLNDKLQTNADLEDLDSQFDIVLRQHALLKQQVCRSFPIL